MINTITILLSLLSTFIVAFTLIFEGKMKSNDRNKLSLLWVQKEIKKISKGGFITLFLALIVNFGNAFISFYNSTDSEKKYIQDTIAKAKLLGVSYRLIDQLKNQSIKDSSTIAYLIEISKLNNIKSDSIKSTIMETAVKTLHEQEKAIEQERENIFFHMQNEVADNLRKLKFSLEESRIRSFGDTNLFISTRLNNAYINKYHNISSRTPIISFFMETSAIIDNVNQYADELLIENTKENRALGIRMLISNCIEAKEHLYSIYGRIYNLRSYKQFESMDFSTDYYEQSTDTLDQYLKLRYYTDPYIPSQY